MQGRIAGWGVALVTLLGIVALGWSGHPAAAQDQHTEKGEALYHQYCGACHGVSADGKGPIATILDPKPPDLRRIAERRDGVFPEVEITRIIDGRDKRVAHGNRDMPVWGKRFGEGRDPRTKEGEIRGEIQMIIKFLKSVQIEG